MPDRCDRSPGCPDLARALEALLIVADGASDTAVLAAALGEPAGEIAAALAELAKEYEAEQRGFRLRHTATGWRLFAAPEHQALLQRAAEQAVPARLSAAALETLAVIAYRQPVTRARVAAIRGVNVDAVVRSLLARDLVEERGVEEVTGAALLGVTSLLLERLGITGVEDLPALAPLLPDLDAPDFDIDLAVT